MDIGEVSIRSSYTSSAPLQRLPISQSGRLHALLFLDRNGYSVKMYVYFMTIYLSIAWCSVLPLSDYLNWLST